MPTLAPRPCTSPGCGVLVRDGAARCAAHKVKAWAKPKEAEPLGGRPWRRKRLFVLQRDAGLCQPSLRHGLMVQATEVDHIVPRARGGTDDDSNLQAIGAAAHEAKSAAERAGLVWDEAAWFRAGQPTGGGQKFKGLGPDTDRFAGFLSAQVAGVGGVK